MCEEVKYITFVSSVENESSSSVTKLTMRTKCFRVWGGELPCFL